MHLDRAACRALPVVATVLLAAGCGQPPPPPGSSAQRMAAYCRDRRQVAALLRSAGPAFDHGAHLSSEVLDAGNSLQLDSANFKLAGDQRWQTLDAVSADLRAWATGLDGGDTPATQLAVDNLQTDLRSAPTCPA